MSIIDPYMPLIYLVAGLTFGAYALKKSVEYLKVRAKETTKFNIEAGTEVKGKNPLRNYATAHDMLGAIEQGLDTQAKAIAKECEKSHKNPMEDTGYMTVVKQYNDAQKWRLRFESPFGQILDGIAFPLVQRLPETLWREIPKMLEGF